ncbi:MAG: hypothetical protein HQ538_05270 [Parcubacteria group bacterium]|nr:hypothetical protein [Parcubacteria group bacterium]
MKRQLSLAIALFVIYFSANASAESMSRIRLYIHGSQEVRENIDIRGHLIPGADLMEGFAPMAYIGAGFRPIEGLDIEPILGWYFMDNEPVLGFLFNLEMWRVWWHVNFEASMPSGICYWFTMLDLRILDWFYVGIEGEGWGVLTDGSSWSNGGGINLIFRMERIEVDVAVHARSLEGELVIPDLLVRFHLFF